MKFVYVFQINESYEKVSIVPPCQGYYTNISVQITSPDAYSETQLFDRFVMSVNLSEQVMSYIAAADGEGQDDDLRIIPNVYTGNMIHQRFKYVEDIAEGTVAKTQYKHFGKKRLYVNKDSDLVNLFYYCADDSAPAQYILIQGDFMPKRGAVYRKQYYVNQISASDDFRSANRMVFDTNLANCQVKATVYTIYQTNPVAARVYFRRGRYGDVEFTDTVATPAGDVFDGDWIEGDKTSGQGMIGHIDISTHEAATGGTAGYSTFHTLLDLGRVRPGDHISWDVRLDIGSGTGNFYLAFDIGGIIPFQAWTEEGDFLACPAIYNINEDPNGVYLVD